MSNMIEVLAEQLQEVNKVIETQARVSDVSFKDVLVLVRFYDEYKNTNEFIDEAEQRAHDNVGALLVCVTKLQGLIRRLLSLDMSVWNEVNFASLEKRHLKAYQDKWNRAKEKSTKLWQKYQSLTQIGHYDFSVSYGKEKSFNFSHIDKNDCRVFSDLAKYRMCLSFVFPR